MREAILTDRRRTAADELQSLGLEVQALGVRGFDPRQELIGVARGWVELLVDVRAVRVRVGGGGVHEGSARAEGFHLGDTRRRQGGLGQSIYIIHNIFKPHSVSNPNIFIGLQNYFTRGFLVPNYFVFILIFL